MGCDTICDLPDSLLTQILLSLPTKDSVKTSVLSTRWRNLWLSVPGLDLHSSHFGSSEVLVRFMDRFMEFNQGSCLHIMRHIAASNSLNRENYNNIDRLMELIGTVVDRGIQHLEVFIYCLTMHNLCGNFNLPVPGCRCYRCVSIYPGCRYYLPRQNIYNSKTLVSLKLLNVELPYPECAVSLPSLKIMTLSKVFYDRDGPLILEKLISGCPVLEDLLLCLPYDIFNESDHVVVLFLRVSSQSLKKCRLGFPNCRIHTDFTVEIDAPRLEHLSLARSRSDRIVVKNLSSLLKIDLLSFEKGSSFESGALRERDFLANISSVRHMLICRNTLEVLYSYSKLGLIPKFHNLYHLKASFSSSLQLLPPLLESCPNLKILSLLDSYRSEKPRQIDFTNVPRCLISSLENVEIKKQMMTDETGIIKLVNYFLENSAVLKKLTLDFFKDTSITNQEAESYKKLITSAKLSLTCQVIIDITQCSKKRSR
ncbi:putative F-box/FBD/LRR-repeat protein [Cardamine amara subsp. amara]|uniref:F-box/FBD/LRR-repeat protein n=1 Tax=Cardamine amara subsp. amara TaxID=228776 RepID=A0ABD1BPA6_CARAN